MRLRWGKGTEGRPEAGGIAPSSSLIGSVTSPDMAEGAKESDDDVLARGSAAPTAPLNLVLNIQGGGEVVERHSHLVGDALTSLPDSFA